MNKLAVTIITKNEQNNIERCLKSVLWADEIIIIDTGSTDNTVDICNSYNCKVMITDWGGFGLTKQFAVNAASHNWILSIDADEEVTPELRNKIQSILKNPEYNCYRIKRNSFYLGQKIKYCGWQRDYPKRLFNRKFGNFNDKVIHESVMIDGKIGQIEYPILHYTYPTIESHLAKMNRYSELGAQQLYNKGKKSSVDAAIIRGIIKFLKMYFFQKGFLDGKIGFILSYNSAFGVYLKYIKLWKMHQ